MADQENKELDVKNLDLDVAELQDADLEDVSGGSGFVDQTVNECPITNFNC